MNIRKWHGWRSSLRYKLIASVLIMTMPLVGMLLYNNFYAIHVVRGQVADSYKNMLTLYMNQIDTGLNDSDSYMNTVAGSNYDLVSLGQAATDSDYYSAKVYLFNRLSRDISLYNSLSSFFVYETRRQDYMDISKSNDVSLEEKESVERHIIDLIHSQQIPKGISTKRWQYFRIGQDYYLIDIVQSGNVYLGGWVKTEQLLKPLRSLQIGEGEVLLANGQGEPITDTNLVSDNGIELHKNVSDYYLSGLTKKFLVVGAASNRGDFNLVALIPDTHILAKLPYLQWIVWLITIASLLFVPIGLYSMRQAILVPLYRVLLTMKKVREGDWSSRVVLTNTSDEFKLLGGSFNAMMTEIETLRVNVYEEQLNKQREELQRLQLQVNPHFFLNTLNIVYNLAKVKNHELVLEMTMSLIHYFRFMFRSNTSFVKMKDELDHTRNYLKIQSLRFPGQLTWTLDAPDYLTDAPIPPLIIQSFVENSIKHAVTMDEPIAISVQIDFLDEEKGSRMKICIKDTGQGFNNQVLKDLQAGKRIENDQGEHTGIWNVQRRLRLLYDETVSIQYDNDKETGGAVVEIILPTNPGMEETT
ncbi:sensor histidine kinase [Paenibacillus sp. V4I5]|uniref:sensor histidine kinase n=1 Tax=Paenibacillus sp. V4I5 TaxID=3042306 RepID=UPI002791A752|nr:histidine kinase [Paenibacillus sp. V4I5]MDQ0916285.1 two-component system sensor histidine kinase YesM [Paenibacillus sp. V4I5]